MVVSKMKTGKISVVQGAWYLIGLIGKKDGKDIPKIHPAQKPVAVIKKLIEIFTDEGDVVIDPCCGSGSTLRAAAELGRSAFGFEIDRTFYTRAKNEMLVFEKDNQLSIFDFFKAEKEAKEQKCGIH